MLVDDIAVVCLGVILLLIISMHLKIASRLNKKIRAYLYQIT